MKYDWYIDDLGHVEGVLKGELPSRYMQLNGHKATKEELKQIGK